MGSEMCIRDSDITSEQFGRFRGPTREMRVSHVEAGRGAPEFKICLLYTSDAADERSSVDLGGRRIIKKKNLTVSVHPADH